MAFFSTCKLTADSDGKHKENVTGWTWQQMSWRVGSAGSHKYAHLSLEFYLHFSQFEDINYLTKCGFRKM